MRIRPFLSHKRANGAAVARLRSELQTRGAGGWKDTEDMRLGAVTNDEILDAIHHRTGGFIWYGTRLALESDTINSLEVPAALGRGHRDPGYTVTPVFVDLKPGSDRDPIETAMGGRIGRQLIERNGILRAPHEPLGLLMSRVACRYVKDAVVDLPTGRPVTAMLSIFRPGDGGHDLTMDWRSIFDCDSRQFHEDGLGRATEALTDIREALQRRTARPAIRVEMYVPMPVALLVGYEWRYTTGIRLEVVQPKGLRTLVIRAGSATSWTPPAPSRKAWRRTGPAVVAVGVGEPLDEAALRYSTAVKARELTIYHVPGLVGKDELLGLAASVASCLRKLNDQGVPKHLLLRGPYGLAFLLGAAMNATGPTTVPFWNGSCYATELVVGGLTPPTA